MPDDPGAGERFANRNLPKSSNSPKPTETEPADPPETEPEAKAKPKPKARKLGDLLPGRAAEDDPERWGDRDGGDDDDRIRREVPPHHG